MRLARRNSVLVVAALSAWFGGCVDAADSEELDAAQGALTSAQESGQELFEEETFDGNGRTCHRGDSGTLSPAEIEALFQENPNDPLFRAIDSDDGLGESYSRLRERATIRVVIPLPPNIRPLDDLEATHVVLNRGIPTTNNTSLDTILMYDGRADDLASQALGAVHDHYENGREPTQQELDDIAAFEETLFTSTMLADFAAGGEEPELPRAVTKQEKRGLSLYKKHCKSCHGGPMLNEDEKEPLDSVFRHFQSVRVGMLDTSVQVNPLREWAVIDPETGEVLQVIPVPFPDPGLALTTGNPGDFTGFKIPTLWGVKDTAPYFHDNSALTLAELMDHYSAFFQFNGQKPLTEQEKADLVAFMERL